MFTIENAKSKIYYELDANKQMLFRTHLDVLAECFGVFLNGHQQATWRLKNNEDWLIWFPKEIKEDTKKKDIVWFNTISADNTSIHEYTKLNDKEYIHKVPYMKYCIRLVFMKIPTVGAYVFKGAFVGNPSKMQDCSHTFTRIATRVRLIGNPVHSIELLDEDRSQLEDSYKSVKQVDSLKDSGKKLIEPLDETYSIEAKEAHAKIMDIDSLRAAAQKHAQKKPLERIVQVKQITRDPYIAEYTKQKANGICQLCEHPAPFANKDGKPYLESHHIISLANGGEDSIENTAALCPNCHKKMHIVADIEDVAFLLEKVQKSNNNN